MASIETRSIPEEAITSLSSRSESSSEPVSTPETEIFSPATLAEQFWYDHRQDILNQLAEGDEPDFYALADLFDSQDYPQLTDDQLEQLEETISFYARNLDYNNSISDLFDRTSDGSVSPVNFTDQQKFAFLIHNFNEFNFCYDDTEEVKPLLEGEDAQLVLTLMLTEFGYLTANPTDDYQRFCQTGHADIAKQVIIDDHLTTVLSTFEHQDNSNPVIACGRHAHFSPTQTPNIAQKLVNIQQAVYLSARNYLAERASKLLPTSQREDYEAILSWLELDEEESNSYDESLFTYSSQDDWLVYIKKYLAYDYVTTANEPFKARQDWPNYLDQYGKLADAHLSSHAHQDSSSSEKLTRFNQTQQLIVFLCRQINVDESTTSFAGEQFAFDNPSALLEQLVAHPEILHENLNSQVLRLFVLQPTRSNWQINFNDLYSAWQQGINTDALLISPDPVAKLKELANLSLEQKQAQKLLEGLTVANPKARFKIELDHNRIFIVGSQPLNKIKLPAYFSRQGKSIIDQQFFRRFGYKQLIAAANDDIYVYNFDATQKEKHKERSLKALSAWMDNPLSNQEGEKIRKNRLPLSREQQLSIDLVIDNFNQLRKKFNRPELFLNANSIKKIPNKIMQEFDENWAGFFNEVSQVMAIVDNRAADLEGALPEENDSEALRLLEFLLISIHELGHAFSYNVVNATPSDDPKYKRTLGSVRSGFHFGGNFSTINEAITQYQTILLFHRLVRTIPLFDDCLHNLPDLSLEQPSLTSRVGHIFDDSGPYITDFYLDQAYQQERETLDQFLDIIAQRSQSSYSKKDLLDLLIQSQINGDWRTFANLIDRTLGKKMFAYLGRASANLEDFQAFVRDLEAGKTAADFSAELLQKRQRQVLAGSQTAS